MSKAFSIDNLRAGNHLEYAKSATLDQFFEARMSNTLKKTVVGNWIILYEDDDFVYWGKPVNKGLLKFGEPKVEAFFKTPLEDIENYFPHFETWEGYHAEKLILKLLEQELMPKAPQYIKFDWSETSKVILNYGYSFSVTCYKDNPVSPPRVQRPLRYRIVLSKYTLEPISIHPFLN